MGRLTERPPWLKNYKWTTGGRGMFTKMRIDEHILLSRMHNPKQTMCPICKDKFIRKDDVLVIKEIKKGTGRGRDFRNYLIIHMSCAPLFNEICNMNSIFHKQELHECTYCKETILYRKLAYMDGKVGMHKGCFIKIMNLIREKGLTSHLVKNMIRRAEWD